MDIVRGVRFIVPQHLPRLVVFTSLEGDHPLRVVDRLHVRLADPRLVRDRDELGDAVTVEISCGDADVIVDRGFTDRCDRADTVTVALSRDNTERGGGVAAPLGAAIEGDERDLGDLEAVLFSLIDQVHDDWRGDHVTALGVSTFRIGSPLAPDDGAELSDRWAILAHGLRFGDARADEGVTDLIVGALFIERARLPWCLALGVDTELLTGATELEGGAASIPIARVNTLTELAGLTLGTADAIAEALGRAITAPAGAIEAGRTATIPTHRALIITHQRRVVQRRVVWSRVRRCVRVRVPRVGVGARVRGFWLDTLVRARVTDLLSRAVRSCGATDLRELPTAPDRDRCDRKKHGERVRSL